MYVYMVQSCRREESQDKDRFSVTGLGHRIECFRSYGYDRIEVFNCCHN